MARLLRGAYNAEMGSMPVQQIDAWLREGGKVVAASERAARALVAAHHRARRAEGQAAWPAPDIQSWQTFLRSAWETSCADGRLLLNDLQEQSLWVEVARAGGQQATLLEGPRHRLAAMAMEAHALLCSYAPRYLQPATRNGWLQDAAAFSGWLKAFDETCRVRKLLSPARLPLELMPLFKKQTVERPPLLLVGFDRILPLQRAFFDAWGPWQEAIHAALAQRICFHRAADEQTELAACALWCGKQLASNPQTRLLVVARDLSRSRGALERAFHRFTGGIAGAAFEFSLGIPLGQVNLARGACLLLRWLAEPIDEHELDWLLSTGQTASSDIEALALTAFQHTLRRRGLERTRWRLQDWIGQQPRAELPAAWVARMTKARNRLQESTQQHSERSPLEWAELVAQLLETAGWPGARPMASAEFQTVQSWQKTVDTCASLGFDGKRMRWAEFLAALQRTVQETLFAPESSDAPILIAGPAETAGLAADAIWFMDAQEDAWPPRGSTHPLLPLTVQREAGMPHATPQLDWHLADAVTRRLLSSAQEVRFSYAHQSEGVEARPARLIGQYAGAPQPLPAELAAPELAEPQTVLVAEDIRIPFPGGAAPGGSSVLTAQSQCPFKAFATARLRARAWKPAEAGLTAAQRGLLLHAVLHAAWGGPPEGIRTHAELLAITDRRAFVERIARRVLREKMPEGVRDWMPQRYLALEEARLVDLVTEWLTYETKRHPFTVLGTEAKSAPSIAGLNLQLRLDRIDRLNDETLLVVDYKTGDVSPKSWDPPRPDDLQLPLYASFGLEPNTVRGGLVFAKVRAGELAFAGRVRNAKGTLLPDLSGNASLVKTKLTEQDLDAWRDFIEKMAREFVAGHAEVDPRAYPNTCEECGLQAMCRIEEARAYAEQEEDTEDEEGDDE